MSLLAGFEDDLHRLTIRVFHVESTPSDDPFDNSGSSEVVWDTPEIPISGQKQSSEESIRAGIEASEEMFRFYSGPDLPEIIDEKHRVKVWRGTESTEGREPSSEFNVRSRIDYVGQHTELEATRINTA